MESAVHRRSSYILFHIVISKYIDIIYYLQAAVSCGLIFFTAIVRYAGGGEQFLKHLTDVPCSLAADGVVHPLALFPAADDPGIAENLHVVGQGGLADIQRIQQLAGTLFAVTEQLQNLYPIFIAQSLEDVGHLSVCAFHDSTSY
jgi:hypothetical protein